MIKVESLSKRFRLYNSPKDRLKEIILRKPFHTEFQVLKNINFEVSDGQALGIIGQNGAGKSTILKILTGILIPDSGTVFIDGKITGIIELGTGFNFEMTGLQNIYMNGTLLQMGKDELDSKKNKIIEFSELKEFIEKPIKTYSSGMIMRLAFSIAIHADPKCFVVDEALSVGDAHFQQKCMNKIKKYRSNGGSILFVSHDMNAVKVLCDRAILLEKGNIIEKGDPETVVNKYNYVISKVDDIEDEITISNNKNSSYGTFESKIKKIVFKGETSKSSIVSSGERAIVTVSVEAYENVKNVNVGISVRDRYGQEIFGTNTYFYKKSLDLVKGKKYKFTFSMEINIGIGKYTVTAAVHTSDTHLERCLHWIDNGAEFEVAGNHGNMFIGICKLYPEIEIEQENIIL